MTSMTARSQVDKNRVDIGTVSLPTVASRWPSVVSRQPLDGRRCGAATYNRSTGEVREVREVRAAMMGGRMFVETSLREFPMPRVAEIARLAEDLGFDGLTFSEVRHDPFVVAAVAAAATTPPAALATSVAIAFPRSPMVVAEATRNLQDLSGGRFTLGLGTQVRGHITRRFSTVWDSPGPRLREYVESLRAIWACWQDGAPLELSGTLLPVHADDPGVQSRADAAPAADRPGGDQPLQRRDDRRCSPTACGVHGFNTAATCATSSGRPCAMPPSRPAARWTTSR